MGMAWVGCVTVTSYKAGSPLAFPVPVQLLSCDSSHCLQHPSHLSSCHGQCGVGGGVTLTVLWTGASLLVLILYHIKAFPNSDCFFSTG